MRNDRHAKKTLLIVTVAELRDLALGACTPQYKNHGYIPPQEDLDKIAIGPGYARYCCPDRRRTRVSGRAC